MKVFDAKRLGELATVSAGYPFRGKVDDLASGDVAVIQMRNVDPQSGIDWRQLSRIELPRASTKAMLRHGDVILSTRGGRFYPYYIGEFEGEAVCSPHFFILRVKTQAILPQFLAWQIKQKPAQDYFVAGATGSNILNIKRDVVENLPIALPPLSQQHHIGDLDEAMRNERSILTQLIDNRAAEMSAIAQQLLATAFLSPEQRIT